MLFNGQLVLQEDNALGSCCHGLRVLTANCRQLERVMMRLTWEFPNRRKKDYLDGTCMVWSQQHLVEIVDYRGPWYDGERYGDGEGEGKSDGEGKGDGDGECKVMVEVMAIAMVKMRTRVMIRAMT